MGNDVAGIVKKLNNNCDVKVNSSICSQLEKILDRINLLLPTIESARPGWTSGILELCSLNNSIDRARLLIQQCAESSVLYLAITGEATLSRCRRISSSLVQSLCQIQDMVPPPLSSKISEILDYIRIAKFELDTQEAEAGRTLLDLLKRTASSEDVELEAFQIAASRLKLTSPKAILIEKRSLNKMLGKLNGSDTKKEKILKYFLYLLKKNAKNVRLDNLEHKENGKEVSTDFTQSTQSSSSTSVFANNDEHSVPSDDPINKICQAIVPPEELCCPISSKLMVDPVVIASGQTYERMEIEKWFDEGHDTCPRTKLKLTNLSMAPNAYMKDLIANWCMEHGINIPEPCYGCNPMDSSCRKLSHNYSISSLNNVSAALLDGNTLKYFIQNDCSNISFMSSPHITNSEDVKGNPEPLISWSDGHRQYQSFSNFSDEMFGRLFYELLELPVDVQIKEMQNVKIILENDEETGSAIFANGFAEALIRILKNAREVANIQAMKSAAQLLLTALCKNRVDLSSLNEDELQLLFSFLDSEISSEALMLLQKLTQNPTCRSKILTYGSIASIVKSLDLENTESVELSLKILLDFSADNRLLKSYILPSRCLTKLACYLKDTTLAHLCLKIIQNISDDDEGAELLAKDSACLASIVELLDSGSKEEQEFAVDILHSICCRSYQNCLLVMDEGVIPALVDISINGNVKAKEISLSLLNLLRGVRCSDPFVNSYINAEQSPEPIKNIVDDPASKQTLSKSVGILVRTLRFFKKSRLSTPFGAHGSKSKLKGTRASWKVMEGQLCANGSKKLCILYKTVMEGQLCANGSKKQCILHEQSYAGFSTRIL